MLHIIIIIFRPILGNFLDEYVVGHQNHYHDEIFILLF